MEAVLVFSNQQHEVTTARARLGYGLRSYALNCIGARRTLAFALGLYNFITTARTRDTYNYNAWHRGKSAAFNPESRLSRFHRSK
jgi:hypothetical protein